MQPWFYYIATTILPQWLIIFFQYVPLIYYHFCCCYCCTLVVFTNLYFSYNHRSSMKSRKISDNYHQCVNIIYLRQKRMKNDDLINFFGFMIFISMSFIPYQHLKKILPYVELCDVSVSFSKVLMENTYLIEQKKHN